MTLPTQKPKSESRDKIRKDGLNASPTTLQDETAFGPSDAAPMSASQILYLQRTIGNRATGQLLNRKISQTAPHIQRAGEADMSRIHAIATELASGERVRSTHLIAVLQQYGGALVRQVYALMPDMFVTREKAFRIMECAEEYEADLVHQVYALMPAVFESRDRAMYFLEFTEDYTAAQIHQVYAINPAVYTSKPIALAVLEFLNQSGGTLSIARYALSKHLGDLDALNALLALLLPLSKLARDTDFTTEQLNVITTYTDYWRGNNFVLTRIKDIVLANSGEEAVEILERTKDYGFDAKYLETASSESEAYGQKVGSEQIAEIDKQEKSDIAGAIASQPEPTTAEKAKLKKKLKVDSKINEAIGKLKEKSAESEIETIKTAAESQRENVRSTDIPSEKASKQEEYRSYYETSLYHPKALEALTVARKDFELAGQIMALINANAKVIPLLVDAKLDAAMLERCVEIPVTELVNLLTKVSIEQFKVYAANKGRLALLRALTAAGVGAPKCQALVPTLPYYDPYTANPTELGHMVTLLQQLRVSDLDPVMRALPPYDVLVTVGKMADMVALLPHADNIVSLVSALKLCEKADWKRPKVMAVFGGLGAGLTKEELIGEISEALIAQFDRATQFKSWLDNVAVLVGSKYLKLLHDDNRYIKPNLSSITIWLAYPADPINGVPDDVDLADSEFYAHTHPQASGASTTAHHASKGHLKPTDDGSLIRVKAGSVPEVLRLLLPSGVREHLK